MSIITKDTGRYFIAIVPPDFISEELQALKNHFRDNFGSKASLNSPPHVTLHMPFEWKEKKEQELIRRLDAFWSTVKPIELTLKDFGCFEPRVIYVDVVENNELKIVQRNLARFCKMELNLFNAQYKNLPFHPHITLAFRDLKKLQFYKAWGEFHRKNYASNFTVNRISLLKYDGKHWKIFKQFETTSLLKIALTNIC